jgi:predicted DNA-binding transcriptional regulator AlpA
MKESLKSSSVNPADAVVDERDVKMQEVLAVPPIVAARMVGLTATQLWRLYHCGKTPSPIYLGRKNPRWRVEELQAWVKAGCPSRSDWQRMKEAKTA